MRLVSADGSEIVFERVVVVAIVGGLFLFCSPLASGISCGDDFVPPVVVLVE
jgi:hypothetical protein